MSKGIKSAISILVMVALTAGGAYLYRVYDGNMSALSQASLDWPSVEGLITRSELKVWSSSSSTRKGANKHDVRVTYEYVVAGRSYSNDVVRFDQNNGSRSEKQKMVSSHPVGKLVDVFYNPDDPDQSVLQKGSYQ